VIGDVGGLLRPSLDTFNLELDDLAIAALVAAAAVVAAVVVIVVVEGEVGVSPSLSDSEGLIRLRLLIERLLCEKEGFAKYCTTLMLFPTDFILERCKHHPTYLYHPTHIHTVISFKKAYQKSISSYDSAYA
jgi:hypothetical protein